MKKKREYQSSELVKSFAKLYGFEDKLFGFTSQGFFEELLPDEAFFKEIESVNLNEKILEIRIKSPLFRNDFRMKKSFFLKKFQEEFGADQFMDVYVL